MNALYNGSLRIKISYFYPEEQFISGAELKWLTVLCLLSHFILLKQSCTIEAKRLETLYLKEIEL